ncbi:MAG TPA: beta-ketoacyl-[acyl-carrier-protein] synthase family protein [Gemmataceae bacterium]|nr:beta-ketoacyl-[acyl-carrier-protein] synthase family protein [Gemmataceae bacterium]
MRRRVVITGMGAITPLGHSVAELYDAQIHGRSGVDWISHFDASTFPTRFAAEVKNFSLSKFLPNAERYRDAGPNTLFALVAAKEALADAAIPTNLPRERFGIYLGNGDGASDFFNLVAAIAKASLPDRTVADVPTFTEAALRTFDPGHEYELEIHTTAGQLAQEFNLPGPNFTCQTACAASSQSVGEALQLIRQNDADIMLAGGSHSMIHPFGVTGFNRLTALSTRNDSPCKASRPFDLNRDGFVLGEGAGMVVLEELEHARKRGANIYAELTGYGSTADAFRVTDSHDEGRGAIACMREALRDSGLDPAAMGYINAHGTSTKVNDQVETLAIKNVFGEHAYRIPVSSSKSMMGHLISAAGATELIIIVMAMRKGVLPPTINYDTPDPECDLDYIPNTAREKWVDHVLSNSFGFGGQNASLIASRFKD